MTGYGCESEEGDRVTGYGCELRSVLRGEGGDEMKGYGCGGDGKEQNDWVCRV